MAGAAAESLPPAQAGVYARTFPCGVVTTDLTGSFWTGLIGRIDLERKEPEMARGKRFSPEQMIAMLRQIEVQLAQGKRLALACKEAGIAEQSYYRWRREYGGLQLEHAKRLKELERENARLRRLVADLALEKQVLKDVAAGNVVQP